MKASLIIFVSSLIAYLPAALADDSAAAQACDALGGSYGLVYDCKGFDGSPGNVSGLRVCADGDTAEFLVADAKGQTSPYDVDDSSQQDSSFTYLASPYALEIPGTPADGMAFDAILTITASDGSQVRTPIVCTHATN